MGLFDRFKKSPEPSPAQEHIIIPAQRTIPPELTYSPQVEVTIGKWVVWNHQVGIVASVIGFPVIEVHLVDADGATISATPAHVQDVRLARYLEIPEKRRPADYAYAASALGYV